MTRWQMVNFGDFNLQAMSTSTDPTMMKLWEGMNFVEYVPLVDVRIF